LRLAGKGAGVTEWNAPQKRRTSAERQELAIMISKTFTRRLEDLESTEAKEE
jgi:hypothetical protein